MGKLYIALLEIRPRPDCPHLPVGASGAMVRCCVSSKSHEEAVAEIRTACYHERFELVDIEWCVDKDEVEWEHPGNSVGDECVCLAYSSSTVVFGEFYTWRDDGREGIDEC